MQSNLDQFAPAILEIYHRDEEAFWAAVMAPFLSEAPLWKLWRHLHVDADLFFTLRSFDRGAKQVLRDFSLPLGFDMTRWRSLRAQYLKDAYPIFVFLAVWMDEQGLSDFLERYGEILRAGILGVSGYGILDVNVDGNHASPVEILTSQALIAEYEAAILEVFGVSPVNLGILHRMRSLYLEAEVKEKSVRWKSSPYRLDDPVECGIKGAQVLTPFMLSLERLGKAALIDDYLEVFFLFGAVIQIIDDWQDLELDLAAGHYSYVTLGFDELHDSKSPQEIARLLREEGPCLRL